jgi:hypothetical protein
MVYWQIMDTVLWKTNDQALPNFEVEQLHLFIIWQILLYQFVFWVNGIQYEGKK